MLVLEHRDRVITEEEPLTPHELSLAHWNFLALTRTLERLKLLLVRRRRAFGRRWVRPRAAHRVTDVGEDMKKLIYACAALVVAAVIAPMTALAHPHAAEKAHGGTGQVLANGQNHPGFVMGESCMTHTLPSNFGQAWYGLETAHHGPDAGNPGKGDGCYMIEGRLSPLNPLSDRNPGIR
jgi:hypothetical protein